MAPPSIEPESEQSIYAQPKLAIYYPTPVEPDQFGPVEVATLFVGILVKPAITAQLVEPDK